LEQVGGYDVVIVLMRCATGISSPTLHLGFLGDFTKLGMLERRQRDTPEESPDIEVGEMGG